MAVYTTECMSNKKSMGWWGLKYPSPSYLQKSFSPFFRSLQPQPSPSFSFKLRKWTSDFPSDLFSFPSDHFVSFVFFFELSSFFALSKATIYVQVYTEETRLKSIIVFSCLTCLSKMYSFSFHYFHPPSFFESKIYRLIWVGSLSDLWRLVINASKMNYYFFVLKEGNLI